MSYVPGAKKGSEGNTRLQSQYGGGSTPPRQEYAKGYKQGGLVTPFDKSLAASDAPKVEGAAAKPRYGRSGKKKAPGKAGANINIVIATQPKEDKMPMPMPVPMPDGPPGGPPMAGPPGPPPGPPMPPPGAGPGGPPMPMRAMGGKVVSRKTGGRVACKEDGGEVGHTPGQKMRALQAKRNQAGKDGAQSLFATGVGALGAGLTRKDHPVGKVLNLASKVGVGAGLFGAGSATNRAVDAKDEMDALGKGKAVAGEEDRKHGGKVCKGK